MKDVQGTPPVAGTDPVKGPGGSWPQGTKPPVHLFASPLTTGDVVVVIGEGELPTDGWAGRQLEVRIRGAIRISREEYAAWLTEQQTWLAALQRGEYDAHLVDPKAFGYLS